MNYKIFKNDVLKTYVVFILISIACFSNASNSYATGEPNYGEALQKAIYFYECQQSGPLPAWNRVQWRGPSCLHDGADAGKDLTGGWYDAGDHVKFNFPMAFSLTMLCWGVIENRDAYEKSGQLPFILNSIRFAADYLIRCHTGPNEFYGQIGDGGLDHSFWGPAESVEAKMQRPSAKIDATHPGTDLAGEAAAALAATSIVFKTTDEAYSSICLTHAKQLYSFADAYRGKYDASIIAAQGYYNSWSGYKDELVWGATWLFLANKDSSYLFKAQSYYDSLNTEPQSTTRSYKWTIAWDDKGFGCYVLLAKLTGKQKYKDDAERCLNYWTIGVDGQKIKYTPGGLAWLDTWGSNRYAANTAFLALIYSDWITGDSLKTRYHDFAVSQINYLLGSNPLHRSFVVGFGNNPPCREHHRTAEGVYPGDASDTVACRHTLYGALVGGPDASDAYTDQRNNYTANEVACDYNAGFTGALARLYKEYGGAPLAQFPPKDSVSEQFYVLANINASGDRFTEIKAVLCNKTNEPARICTKLSYRYFFNISEAISAGLSANDITVQTNYLQGKAKISGVTPYNGSSSIYYVEISYDNDSLYPGTQDSYKREAQFRLSLPQNAIASSWITSNDWSYETVGGSSQTAMESANTPIYDNGVQIWGAEPGKPPISIVSPQNHIFAKSKSCSFVKHIGNYLVVEDADPRAATVSVVAVNGKIATAVPVGHAQRISMLGFGNGMYICVVSDKYGKPVSAKPIVLQR